MSSVILRYEDEFGPIQQDWRFPDATDREIEAACRRALESGRKLEPYDFGMSQWACDEVTSRGGVA